MVRCSPICIATLLWLSARPVPGADAAISAETATFELCAECPPPQIHVLVKTADKVTIDPKDDPSVEQVLMAGQRDDGLRTAFRAQWQVDANGRPRAIDITYAGRDHPVLMAGSYDLYLDVQPTANPPAPWLKITITRSAPKLSVYPKVIVERTWRAPYYAVQEKSPQVLDETSKKSGATGIAIRIAAPAVHGTEPSTGSLAFSNLPENLRPGGRTRGLDYKLTGHFSLGTTTGTMKIVANETPEALATFDFEVHNKVSALYLVLILVIGLACSSWFKVKLQQEIEWDQAYLDASALLDRVSAEEARHADSAFRNDYKQQRDALDAAMKDKDAIKVNTAKLALDEAWKKALDALAKRRQPEVEAYERLDESLRSVARLDLPKDQMAVITKAREGYASAKDWLDNDDFVKVRQASEATIKAVSESLSKYAADWKPNIKQTIGTLAKTPVGLSAQLVKDCVDHSASVTAVLEKIDEKAVITTPDQLKEAALNLHAARKTAAQFFSDLAINHQIEGLNADGQIRRAKAAAWKPQPFEAVRSSSRELESLLGGLAESPDPAGLAMRLNALHQAWSDALAAQFNPPDEEVQTLVESTRYGDALTLTLRKLRPRVEKPAEETSKVRTVGKRRLEPDEIEQAPTLFSWREFFAPPELTVLHIESRSVPSFPPALPTKVTVARQLWRNKLLQTLGVAVFAGLGGYGLFSSNWVGTFADFSAAFFWAFGLDLTLDAVMKVVKRS